MAGHDSREGNNKHLSYQGVVGDGGVDRLGLAEGIGRRPVGTPSTTMGIVTCGILKRGALKELCD